MLPMDEFEYNLIAQERGGPLAPDVTRSEFEREEEGDDE